MNTSSFKIFKLILAILLVSISVEAQSVNHLTIEDCYNLARQNYPLAKQHDLIAKSNQYSVENISKGYWPQLNINGQATYQSDVPQLPDIKIPNFPIKSLIPVVNKDQYKVYGEINQPLTDMLTVKEQKEYQEEASAIKSENLEVELYKLRDRITQLYFGALLIDEQYAQNELLKKDIETGITKMKAAIANGVEFRSSLDKLKVEEIKANQRSIELKSSRKAYTDMLALFINRNIDESTILEKPKSTVLNANINRPELNVFSLQQKTYAVQKDLINVKNLPRLGLFFQGGLGNPSPLNPYKTEWSTYYIGGLRLNWSLSGLYTFKKEKQLLDIDQMMLDAQRETFLFNTNITLKQQNDEISKYEELLKSDDEIISLRVSIKNTSNTQLENGVITANDYLKEINAEDQARQSKLLHEIQLLIAQYNYKNTSGN